MSTRIHSKYRLFGALHSRPTLLGDWTCATKLTNRMGTVTCQEVYSFSQDGSMAWHYTETGAPEQHQLFTYIVKGDRIEMTVVEGQVTTSARYRFAGDTMVMAFEQETDVLILRKRLS